MTNTNIFTAQNFKKLTILQLNSNRLEYIHYMICW